MLAERLGRSVNELRQTMSSREYQEWLAFSTWRAAMQDFEQRKVQARGSR